MRRRPSLRAALNRMRDQQIDTAVTASRTAAARAEREKKIQPKAERRAR